MAGGAAVELPAQLAIRLLQSELASALVKVLQVYLVLAFHTGLFLRRLQLFLKLLVLVSTFGKVLAQHASGSENLERIRNPLPNEMLGQVLTFVATFSIVTRLRFLLGRF